MLYETDYRSGEVAPDTQVRYQEKINIMNDKLSRHVMHILRPLVLVTLLLVQVQYATADLILTAPPRESKEAGQKLYALWRHA